jgi:hypothetical protein
MEKCGKNIWKAGRVVGVFSDIPSITGKKNAEKIQNIEKHTEMQEKFQTYRDGD